MSNSAAALKTGRRTKPENNNFPRLEKVVPVNKKEEKDVTPSIARHQGSGNVPSFMHEKPPSVWVIWTSVVAAMSGITFPMMVAMLAVQHPILFGLSSAQFSLVVPAGYWFIDLSVCVALVLLTNFLLMFFALNKDEPVAFLFNAGISIIMVVSTYVVPQFVDLSCRGLPSGCIPSSIHFIWMQ